MDCCKNYFEGRCEECHAELPAPGQFCEEIGLTVKVASNRFFAHGSGNDPVELAFERIIAGGFQIGESELA